MLMNHTRYHKYTDSQLTFLFSTNSWKNLSASQRLAACQEVENRYAAENNVKPCTVTSRPIEGRCYGWQNGNTICLNSYLLNDNQFCTTFTDMNGNKQTIRTSVNAAGWNTLDTIYHEGTHGIQEQTGRIPSTYISDRMDYDLYRIQGIEKEAFEKGQTKTLEALSRYEKECGTLDPERASYLATVNSESYQRSLSNAIHNFKDPNIDLTLQTYISDREKGIVRINASDSYNAISDMYDSYHQNPTMTQNTIGLNTQTQDNLAGLNTSGQDNPVNIPSQDNSSGLSTPIQDQNLNEPAQNTLIQTPTQMTDPVLDDGIDDYLSNDSQQSPLLTQDDGMNDYSTSGISENVNDGSEEFSTYSIPQSASDDHDMDYE